MGIRPPHRRFASTKRLALAGALIGTSAIAAPAAELVRARITDLAAQNPAAQQVGNEDEKPQGNPPKPPRPDEPANQEPTDSGPGNQNKPKTNQTQNKQPQNNQPETNKPNQNQSADDEKSPSDVPPLNTDPNATIDDLRPDDDLPDLDIDIGNIDDFGLGSTLAGVSASPNTIGDLFGPVANLSLVARVTFAQHAQGDILTGAPGDPSSLIGFEFGGNLTPDVFTIPNTGLDLVGGADGADTFTIAEPIPPNDALTSPGPGFVFDGGTAVYTNSNSPGATSAVAGQFQDNEFWFVSYSYSLSLGVDPITGEPLRPVPGPGVATRRIKIAENFSPEVRDRCYLNYSFFNDSTANLGDISRYVLGVERVLFDDLVSLEARLPMAGTYASRQVFENGPARDFELGNTTLILKTILLKDRRFTLSGGLGVALPLADDTIMATGGQNIIRIRNESIHLAPFLGLIVRRNRDSAIQTYFQLDIAANGNAVFANPLGGTLPKIGMFNDSTLAHFDVAYSRTLYRNTKARFLKQATGNLEMHYTGTLQPSDVVAANGITFQNLKRHNNIVNTTVGAHLFLGKNIVVTPGMSVPLRTGLDAQFDYEAMVQVNWFK